MKYSFQELKVYELVNIIDKKKVNLNPEYQRNFIWSSNDQSDLVDTILKGYPIPNFFMYENNDGTYEMVDGQQRSKTIFRFVKGLILSSKNSGKLSFEDCDTEKILNYRLPFIIMKELDSKDSLRDFYVLINKKGKHLNPPEVNKSEYFDTNFLKLANEVLDYQNLINLNLFTKTASDRMNDRAYIEELLAYLKLGIDDKKKSVEKLFENDISLEESASIKTDFYNVIDRIEQLNKIQPIKSTRYRQKNDFYTLFNFVYENMGQSDSLLKYQYNILLVLDGNDEDGKQLIRPSNENCEALKDYAIRCVTQSNSKDARYYRLGFFNSILKNTDTEKNQKLIDILEYLGEVYDPDLVDLKKVEDYMLLDFEKLQKA